jgi:3-methyl-2-oxobutanoate hydroxymethyltransferase
MCPPRTTRLESGPVTVTTLQEMKRRGEKIVVLTAYDALTAGMLDEAGIDVLLVGDSSGMVFAGHETTIPVEMEHMLYHVASVKRGTQRALIVGDMPFLSYQPSLRDAITNAGRFLKAGAHAVKLECGREVFGIAKALVGFGIPVMGHIGLTPQSINRFGSYRVRGRTKDEEKELIAGALALQKAGCFSIVLEKVPYDLAKRLTARLGIPTIGIGAGPYCDGQVLVVDDMLGRFEKFVPKFVKRYAEVAKITKEACTRYRDEVKAGKFPTLAHSFSAKKK